LKEMWLAVDAGGWMRSLSITQGLAGVSKYISEPQAATALGIGQRFILAGIVVLGVFEGWQ
jgi:hypothetical protein